MKSNNKKLDSSSWSECFERLEALELSSSPPPSPSSELNPWDDAMGRINDALNTSSEVESDRYDVWSNQSDEASVPESKGSSSSYNPSSQHPIPSPVEDVEATPMAHIEDGSVLYEHQSESDDLDSKVNYYFEEPLYWSDAFNNLETLTANQWVDAVVLDMYAMHLWQNSHEPSVIYVGFMFGRGDEPNEEEIERCKKVYGMRALMPTAVIVLHDQHYFVAIFDWDNRDIYILGTAQVEWFESNGHRYWDRISQLFCWDVDPFETTKIHATTWMQVCAVFLRYEEH